MTPENPAAMSAVTTFLFVVLAAIVVTAAFAYGTWTAIRRARERRTGKRP